MITKNKRKQKKAILFAFSCVYARLFAVTGEGISRFGCIQAPHGGRARGRDAQGRTHTKGSAG
jgi:hypothetical protein